jgi:EF-P beta-lysylation protein EpmB
MTLPLIDEAWHFSQPWQQQLANAFVAVDKLCAYLQISPQDLPFSEQAALNFPIRVPLSFASSMEKQNPFDPLLRQVLPVHDELLEYFGYDNDPVGDIAAEVMPGILHKYQGRALLINTGTCAIHCRYCFRRNFPYADHQLSHSKEIQALDYLRNDLTITEVILSGGDPLLLSDNRLKVLMMQLSAIDHVQRLRIHTRLPIVLPARINDSLLALFSEIDKQIVVVIHCNHANEINWQVGQTLNKLRKAGIFLLNQSVLLKDINDSADLLCRLSEKLFAYGVMPYYLHLLDRATGTGHFEVSESCAQSLMKKIQTALPGYLVPKLVKDKPHALSKEYRFPAP